MVFYNKKKNKGKPKLGRRIKAYLASKFPVPSIFGKAKPGAKPLIFMFTYDATKTLETFFDAGFSSVSVVKTNHGGWIGAWIFGRGNRQAETPRAASRAPALYQAFLRPRLARFQRARV